MADFQYEEVKNCTYTVFNEYIDKYIKENIRGFDSQYNKNLRTILIDVILDIASDTKVS